MKKILLFIFMAAAVISAAFYFGYISRPAPKLLEQAKQLPPAEKISASKPQIISYLTASQASFSSLKKNLSVLNVVIGEWLNFYDAGGVKLISPESQKIQIAYLHSAQPANQNLQIVALLKNYSGGSWRGNEAAELLKDAGVRKQLEQQILDYLQANALNGVSIDFENMPSSAQKDFELFLSELHTELEKKNMQLSVNLPADGAGINYPQIANSADQLILMFYDQHNPATEAGAISALPWFKELLQKRSREIASNKLVVALGNYAYDWPAGSSATGLTVAAAEALARRQQSPLQFDEVAQNNFYKYTDQGKREHTVWILDAASVAAEIRAAMPLNPYAFALYRLGSEDQQAWAQFPR